MTNNRSDTRSYRYAERRITDLVNKFQAKGICPCCAGRALMVIAMAVCEASMGSAEAADLGAKLSDGAREHNRPAPDYPTTH
jgi:hypothetical protein